MTAKELFNAVNFEDVFLKVKEIEDSYELSVDVTKLKEFYKKAFYEISNIEIEKDKEKTLIVMKNYISDDNSLESFYVINEDLKKADIENMTIDDFEEGEALDIYSIMFVPWAEIVGYSVCNLSIENYGETTVCAIIFMEMVMFGFSEAEAKKNKQREIDILNERAKEVEAGNVQGYSADEVFAHLEEKYGFERDTEYIPPSEDEIIQNMKDELEDRKSYYHDILKTLNKE